MTARNPNSVEQQRAGTARYQYGSFSNKESEKNSGLPSPQDQFRSSHDLVPLAENTRPPVTSNPLAYLKKKISSWGKKSQIEEPLVGKSEESEAPMGQRDIETSKRPSQSRMRESDRSYDNRLELVILSLRKKVEELEEKIADEKRRSARSGEREDRLRSYIISELFDDLLEDLTQQKTENSIKEMEEYIKESLEDFEIIINTRFKDINMQGFQEIRQGEIKQIQLVYAYFMDLSIVIENYETEQHHYEPLMAIIIKEVNKLRDMELAYMSTFH